MKKELILAISLMILFVGLSGCNEEVPDQIFSWQNKNRPIQIAIDQPARCSMHCN